jgi:SAM-dependent methyltransferase
MNQPSDYQPLERFTGLAKLYSQYRPTYPEAALDYVIHRARLNAQSVLVDVGCGTGIASRQFAERGISVIGIEPNQEMRRQAEAEAEGASNRIFAPRYQEGRAEATGLLDASAHAVLAAQAFHWFEWEAALREFHRILKPNGLVVLMWNERDESDPFTQAYGDGVRRLTDAEVFEPFHGRGEVLLKSPVFEDGEQAFFPNDQILDEEGILGRALSVSYAPRDGTPAREYADEVREIFQRFQREGKIIMRYQTSVFLARRRALVSTSRIS